MPICPAATSWFCWRIALMTSPGVSERASSCCGLSQTRMLYWPIPKTVDVADPRQPREHVAHANRGIVTEEQTVEARLVAGEGDDLQDRRGLLARDHAVVLYGIGQRRERGCDAVLHQHLREIQVRADLEGHRERVVTVVGARRLHVEHVLDAVHLLLDGQGDGVDERAGIGTGIARGDLHRGWSDGRILGYRQSQRARRNRAAW